MNNNLPNSSNRPSDPPTQNKGRLPIFTTHKEYIKPSMGANYQTLPQSQIPNRPRGYGKEIILQPNPRIKILSPTFRRQNQNIQTSKKFLSPKHQIQSIQTEQQYFQNRIKETEIEKAILSYQQNQLPTYQPEQFLILHKSYLEQQYGPNHQVKLGMFGKYYCGGKLGGKPCNCCNGICGPTNGENCVKCMRLDQLRRGLKPQELVNNDGSVCWVTEEHRTEGIYSCGNLLGSDENHCGQATALCYSCSKLNKNIDRYASLIAISKE